MNGFNQIYIERAGKLEFVPNSSFNDNQHLMQIIDRIVSWVGPRVDESSLMVDARLPDGSRVHAIIPPVAVDGPYLSIRRFGQEPVTARTLIENKTMMAPILCAPLSHRAGPIERSDFRRNRRWEDDAAQRSIGLYIPNAERVITIEDAAELQLKRNHVLGLETRPPNIEGERCYPPTGSSNQQPPNAARPYRGGL